MKDELMEPRATEGSTIPIATPSECHAALGEYIDYRVHAYLASYSED